MKTTIEIAPDLFEEARRQAAQDGQSFRALVEEGLRRVLADRQGRRAEFRLRAAAFKGSGLAPEFAAESWPETREAIYYRGREA